jgi:hypothetical protein
MHLLSVCGIDYNFAFSSSLCELIKLIKASVTFLFQTLTFKVLDNIFSVSSPLSLLEVTVLS